MKNKRWLDRFGFAWAGIIGAWRNERSFRTQTAFAFALPVVLFLLHVTAVWWAICLTLAFLVLAAELFNTALEAISDVLRPDNHPVIKIAKDSAAGAVLLLSICSLIVGLIAVLVKGGLIT